MAIARMFLASIAIVVGLVGTARAEIAASIDYGFVERPASLPAEAANSRSRVRAASSQGLRLR